MLFCLGNSVQPILLKCLLKQGLKDVVSDAKMCPQASERRMHWDIPNVLVNTVLNSAKNVLKVQAVLVKSTVSI